MFMIIDKQKNTIVVKSLSNVEYSCDDIQQHQTSADLIADIRKFLKGEYTDNESEVNI